MTSQSAKAARSRYGSHERRRGGRAHAAKRDRVFNANRSQIGVRIMNSSTTRAFHGFDARRALVRETTRAAIGNFGYFYVSTLSGTKPSDLKKESN